MRIGVQTFTDPGAIENYGPRPGQAPDSNPLLPTKAIRAIEILDQGHKALKVNLCRGVTVESCKLLPN